MLWRFGTGSPHPKKLIDLTTFHQCLVQPTARGYDLDEKQKEAVKYGDGPLWLLAGPGSGKSEVLVTRTLKLLCVDGVDPGSILLTTFTDKAARNLQDRLATYLAALQNAEPNLKDVDLLPKICASSLIQINQGRFLKLNLLEIIYRILSLEPFRTWRLEPIKNLCLAKVTRLFEGYNSFKLDVLQSNTAGNYIDDSFLNRLYNMFIGYLYVSFGEIVETKQEALHLFDILHQMAANGGKVYITVGSDKEYYPILRQLSNKSDRIQVRTLPELHAKAYVGRYGAIDGSLNLTAGGVNQNIEMFTYYHDERNIAQLRKLCQEFFEKGLRL